MAALSEGDAEGGLSAGQMARLGLALPLEGEDGPEAGGGHQEEEGEEVGVHLGHAYAELLCALTVYFFLRRIIWPTVSTLKKLTKTITREAVAE